MTWLESSPSLINALGWDTSTHRGSVAIVRFQKPFGLLPTEISQSARVLAEWNQDLKSSHSESLLQGIDSVLKKAQLKLEEIHFLGIGVGPGSFTGLRVGLGTAKIFSEQKRIPMKAVSSLEIEGRSTFAGSTEKSWSGVLVILREAALGECFAYVTDSERWNQGESPVFEGAWKVKDLAKNLAKLRPQFLLDPFQIAQGLQLKDAPQHLVPGSALAKSASEIAIRLGCLQGWDDSVALEPAYFQASHAELKLKAGLLKSSS